MKNLFLFLIWPAAVGNVIWALFTVAVQKSWSNDGVCARLAVLLLLAIYLFSNWRRIQRLVDAEVKPTYRVADAFHLATIVVFAIATQLDKAWLEAPLALIFASTSLGHLLNVWKLPDSTNCRNRWWLVGVNALGLVVLHVSHFFAEPYPWNLPVAVAIVLVAWFTVRKW